MFDVITFGSAIEDNFLRLKQEDYEILKSKSSGGKNICFSLGSKFLIEEAGIETGGGGTNAAATFALQELKTAYCGKVGKDKKSSDIIKNLKKFSSNTSLIIKDKKLPTAYAIVLSPGAYEKERTILIRRGACHYFKKDEVPWEKIKKTKWLYLAPLSGETAKIFPDIVNFAEKNKIKTAANLGNSQLILKKDILEPVLKKLAVLILNKEEAELLTNRKNEADIIKRIKELTNAVVVITKGREGAVVFNSRNIFKAIPPKVKVVEKTGAGDAFGAGFLSGLLQKNDLEYAIQLATLNAVSCIQQIGAKNGLLNKGERLRKIIITKTSLS